LRIVFVTKEKDKIRCLV